MAGARRRDPRQQLLAAALRQRPYGRRPRHHPEQHGDHDRRRPSATFDFASIFSPGSEIELVTPFPLTPETARWGHTQFGVGRLRPSASVAQAAAELAMVSERLQKTTGGKDGAIVTSLSEALRGKFRAAFLLLTGAVLCVLAIACVNLSNLLLARTNVRRQEFAVSIALGAGRRHLVQQALTESLLLALAGAIVGVPVAVWATRALARLQTFGVPFLQDARVDPTALAVTIGLTTLAGIACGVLPAITLSRGHRSQALHDATHQRSAGRSTAAARNTLVVAEVALACVLLVGAGLLFRSFGALLQVDLGFQPRHAMAWRVDTPRNFASGAEVESYFGGAARRIAALPGVEAVGFSDTLPLAAIARGALARSVCNTPKEIYPDAYPRLVDPHYLRVMHIPLVAGRLFDEDYDPQAPKAVIINQTLAHRLSPDRDPLGRKINVNGESTVIGVVGNVRHATLEDAGGNEMYLDYRQSGDWSGMEVVVRNSLPPQSLVPEVRKALAAYDPTLPNGEFYELDRLIDNAVAPRRLVTQLLGFFSALALTLAALGLYGVLAYSVVQRRQEIGIRMAIGAQRRDVLQLVLTSGLRLVAVGVGLGLAGAFALTRLLQNLLFGVTAHDPLVFASIICHASGNIYSFDLNTFKYNILSPEIAPDISQGGSNGQAYNYLDQQYLYLSGLIDSLYYYSILISGKNGSFIDPSHILNNKVPWCPYEHINVPMGLIYDYNTDSYFGIIPEPEPVDCYVTIARVVRFDPLSGTSDSITTFYNLNTLNEQAVSFDPKNRIYMVPSVYDSFKNGKDTLKDSLVLIDLNNNGFIKKDSLILPVEPSTIWGLRHCFPSAIR